MQHPGGGASAGGHTAKHARSKKHVHGKGKKHHPAHHKQPHHQHHKPKVHTVAHHAKHPRGLAVGGLLPVCTFEALAMSLRLAGQRVTDDDLLELWALAGAREVSIAEALDAAAAFGLTRCRPDGMLASPLTCDYAEGQSHFRRSGNGPGNGMVGLILGVDVPGPHAVLATPDGWWSWGSLWSPWTRAVSEAWVISWQ